MDELAVPLQRIKPLSHVHIPSIAMGDHRLERTACRAGEVAEHSRYQPAWFPAVIGSAFFNEYPDGTQYEGVAILGYQADVSADRAFRHGAILWSTFQFAIR